MRLHLFLLLAIPLYIGWVLYHALVKKDFSKIKSDAGIGFLFLAVASAVFYLLFVF
jgi:hypothetical protein